MDSLNNLSQYIKYIHSDFDNALTGLEPPTTPDSPILNKNKQVPSASPNFETLEEKKIQVTENDLNLRKENLEAPDSYKSLPKRSKDQPIEFVTELKKKAAQSTFHNHLLTDLLVKGSFLMFNFLMMKSLDSDHNSAQETEKEA